MVTTIINFFNCPFFIIIGGLSTVMMVCGFSYTLILVIKGVIPVWYRLGMGLSKRKIAIFSCPDEYRSLKSMLTDSKIFKDNNIMPINKNDLHKAAQESVFLVYWPDYKDKIDEILKIKKDTTALIVYAPQNGEKIDPTTLNKINEHRNSIIVNLRGRLINDVLVSLITTSFKRK
jgi:hypothetical protein